MRKLPTIAIQLLMYARMAMCSGRMMMMLYSSGQPNGWLSPRNRIMMSIVMSRSVMNVLPVMVSSAVMIWPSVSFGWYSIFISLFLVSS